MLSRVGSAMCAVLVVLRPGDVALPEHLLEHEVAALRGRLRVRDRVVAVRRGDDRRRAAPTRPGSSRAAQWSSGLPQPVEVAAEVGPCGGLDPVGAVAEVDRVQVLGEDLLLRPLAREVVRQRGLAELLEDRPVVLRLQRVLDELLGDRGAALGAASELTSASRRGPMPRTSTPVFW